MRKARRAGLALPDRLLHPPRRRFDRDARRLFAVTHADDYCFRKLDTSFAVVSAEHTDDVARWRIEKASPEMGDCGAQDAGCGRVDCMNAADGFLHAHGNVIRVGGGLGSTVAGVHDWLSANASTVSRSRRAGDQVAGS